MKMLGLWVRTRAIVRGLVTGALPDDGHLRAMMRVIDRRVTGLLAPSNRMKGRRQHLPGRSGRMTGLPFGVNVVGDFGCESGISVAAAAVQEALKSAGVQVRQVSTGPLGFELAEGALEYSVNLLHLKPGRLAEFFYGNAWSPGLDRYNIGYWAWEMPVLPPEYGAELGLLDEVWVPSAFTASAIVRAAGPPVKVVPLPVGPAGVPDRARFGFRNGEYVFLTVFDFRSLSARKNPLAAVTAFREAFGDDEGARLVIKHINSDKRPGDFAALERAAGARNITLLGDLMPRDALMSLIASCDCYVSLHRAEGFGLTMAEAMAAGRPVIATAYSGNMDFMDESNSYPVRYSPVELERDLPPFSRGDRWAEPDTEHAATLMRMLRLDPEAGKRIGEKAALDTASRLSYEAVGAVCRESLEAAVPGDSRTVGAGITI